MKFEPFYSSCKIGKTFDRKTLKFSNIKVKGNSVKSKVLMKYQASFLHDHIW